MPSLYRDPERRERGGCAKFLMICGVISLVCAGGIGVLIILSLFTSSSQVNKSVASTESRLVIPQVLKSEAEKDPKLLELVSRQWQRGGPDSFARWRVIFHNRSDQPIGKIKFRATYYSEAGRPIGSDHSPPAERMIEIVIPPGKRLTLEINDALAPSRARAANFEVVSWQFISSNPTP